MMNKTLRLHRLVSSVDCLRCIYESKHCSLNDTNTHTVSLYFRCNYSM